MNLGWIIQIIIVIIVISIVLSLVGKMTGFSLADLIWAIRGTRKVKMEIQARDHYDRFVEGHRKSARDDRPPFLRQLWVTGDQDVPIFRVGRIIGIEKFKSSCIVYVKTRFLSWSIPHVIPEELTSDINGKVLWVRSRGFWSNGPVRLPIPLETESNMWGIIMSAWQDFHSLFEYQTHSDITEDSAWSIAQAMQPPYHELHMAADIQLPAMQERPQVSEDELAGGKKA